MDSINEFLKSFKKYEININGKNLKTLIDGYPETFNVNIFDSSFYLEQDSIEDYYLFPISEKKIINILFIKKNRFDKNLQPIKETMLEAMVEARVYLDNAFKHPIDYRFKQDKKRVDVVTNHDVNAEKIITDKIKSEYFEHTIIAEEKYSQYNKSPYSWFVDPIDGTKNFIHHISDWAICIAVSYHNKIVLACIAVPDNLLIASIGGGTYLNGELVKCVNQPKDLNHSLWMIDFLNINASELPILGFRISGSIAIDTLKIIKRKLHGICYPRIAPWDIAAPYLILKEAGYKVTNINKRGFNVFENSFLTANPDLHKAMFEIING